MRGLYREWIAAHGRKYSSYVKVSQFFFLFLFISSLFGMTFEMCVWESGGSPKLTDNVSLTAQPDDLLSVGLLHTTSPGPGCGSSLDSRQTVALLVWMPYPFSWLLWFPDLVHLERQPCWAEQPGIWPVPDFSPTNYNPIGFRGSFYTCYNIKLASGFFSLNIFSSSHLSSI